MSGARLHRPIVRQLEVMRRQLDLLEARRARPAGVPLTPIQRWFFERDLPDRSHFNQAWLMCSRGALGPAELREAVRLLLARHPALRHRFVRRGDAWEQIVDGEAPHVPFESLDLSALRADEQRREIARVAASAQGQLDISAGPLIRVVHARLGGGEPDRLLLVAHHLAVDLRSWAVLLEELAGAHAALRAGGEVRLPAPTAPFAAWASRLAAFARGPEVRAEAPRWLEIASAPAADLPFDASRDRVGAARDVSRRLTGAQSADLWGRVPRALGVRVVEVVIWALARALSDLTAAPHARIDLEGHGREPLFDDLRIDRTVGWFTSLHPLLVTPRRGAPLAEELREVAAELRGVPRGGIGYGLLRYMRGDAALAGALAAARAPVCLSFVGRAGAAGGAGEGLTPAPEPAGATRRADEPRPYGLEVTAGDDAGAFALHCSSAGELADSGFTGRLLDLALSRIDAAVAAARSAPPAPAGARRAGAGRGLFDV
ncbi:MAG: hypothetical protein IT372_13530 [Polyangiaceae bacterium]|nr:hypothetical protein [Polyangiaceae bacterium]